MSHAENLGPNSSKHFAPMHPLGEDMSKIWDQIPEKNAPMFPLVEGMSEIWDRIPDNILRFFQNPFSPKNPDTAWHGIFMTRHDTPKYGMAQYAKIWHGTWSHDMAWHGATLNY